ncbi:MAG: hemolysin III family protein, partial [Gammaproteobacteria bacterium]|nr:hemolysin III family protein [Gammaproteobacteria bacterium]
MDTLPIPGFSDPFSSISHLLTAAVALVGFYFLFRKGRANASRVFALAVYTFSLVFLFSMSGVYHLLDPLYLPHLVFQRLDHAAIWILIAGTFTPLHMILFRGSWRWGVLFLVWTIAITGLTLEAVFFEDVPAWLSLSFYLGLGWIGVLTSWHFRRTFGDASIRYLWMGGLFYSVGGLLDFMKWPVIIPGVLGPHELFHIFVIIGAAYHWWFVYKWAHYPTRNRLTFEVSVFPDERYVAKAVGENLTIEAFSGDELKQKIRETVNQIFHVNM